MKLGNEVKSKGHSAGRGARHGKIADGNGKPVQPQHHTGSGLATDDERWRLIAEAAYYRAQARGFAPGQETDDWLHAEAEIDRSLRSA